MSQSYIRVHNKKDTHESWSQLNPVLSDGEIAVVLCDDDVQLKIGDGITPYKNLPFLDEKFKDSLESHLSSIEETYSTQFTSIVDQITDIKEEYNISIEGINSSINSMKENYEEEFTSINSDITSLDEELSKQVTILGTKMNSIKEDYGSELAIVNDRITSLDGELNEQGINLDTKITSAKEDLSNQIDDLSTKMNSVESETKDELNSIDSNITSMKEDYDSELDTIHSHINSMEESYDHELNSMNSNITSMKEEYDSEIDTINSHITSLDGEFTNQFSILDTKMTSMKEDYDSELDTIDTRIKHISDIIEDTPEYASNAEVVDIRIGYDGNIHDSAGDAVRSLGSEIQELRDNLVELDIELNPNDLGLERDLVTGIVYPTYKGERSSTGVQISAGGGSTTGTIFKLRSTTPNPSFTIAAGSTAAISYTFTSVDAYDGVATGNGIASYYVNSSMIHKTTVKQGEVFFDCTNYLHAGENEISVTVIDSEGESKSLTWYITCIEIYITSTFDYTLSYNGDVTFKYTAYGEVEKDVHFVLDGTSIDTVTVLSSGKQDTKVFSNLDHGVHTLSVYMTAKVNESDIVSNYLNYDILIVKSDSVTPVISLMCDNREVVQGELLDMSFIVIDPLSTDSQVTLSTYYLKDGHYQLYQEETRIVNRSLQHWSTRNYPLGDVKFTVTLRDILRSINVTVNENSLPIAPTDNDLELYLSSANRANSEENPAKWSYKEVNTTFYDFNWTSSGWIADDTGNVSLHLGSGSRAVVGFKPFSTDLRLYGKTIEFDFAVRDVNTRDVDVISCKDGDIGINITSDTAKLTSNLSSIECKFKDERRIRVAFVIESRSEYRLMSIYINGVQTKAKQYVSTDNFEQLNPVDITIGSDYCSVDIYNIRSYSTALTQEELLNNYICDIVDIADKMKIYERNDLYDSSRKLLYEKVKKSIPVMTIVGDLPASKGDKKDVHIYYEHPEYSTTNITNLPCKIDVQGTSSQWYVRKNYKLKFDEYITHVPGAIASKVFCVKADYAEATGTHNTQNANFIHTLYSDKTPAQLVDSNCRTTILGFPIVIYHKKSEDSIPTFLGKYNYNYDKGSEEAFGFTENFDVESWEFCNNTSNACNFTGNIPLEYKMSDENDNEIGWVNDFERRYPDNDDVMNEEAIARFRLMHDWVVSSSLYDLSDSTDLSNYRSEFEKRFNLHKCLIYYIYTFVMLMVDQRAKNMFMTYWGETDKWEPWFYDNDTCLGINNEGQLVFDYYHEDTDLLEDGSKVYNGQDSILWNQFRVAYSNEIKETYQELRNSGKLTYDKLYNRFVVEGSSKWSESIYNEDSDFKYISMLRTEGDATNVPQITGTGEHHLEYILDSRINYCDSKWYAADYANDHIVLRVNTPEVYGNIVPNANITVTLYSTMYAGIRYRANGTLQQSKVKKNTPYTFVAPADNFNDTETAIYGASNVSSLGDLSPLYCNYCDVSKAKKLVILKLGNSDPTYVSRLETLSLGTNRLLKILDITNCTSLTNPVDLTGCPHIEEIYAEGSSISSLELPNSGYLKIVHLPSTISTLTMKNQLFIEDFSMTSYASIKEVNIDNSINLPIKDILLGTEVLERVRLVNVHWDCTSSELNTIYEKLLVCGGIDETGANTKKSVVSGIVNLPSIDSDLLAKLNTDFPELMISINGVIMCTVSFYNTDGKLLYVTTVEQGKDVEDPVLSGKIEPPTKESTLDYRYTYLKWSDSLTNIQKSKSLVAVYETLYAVKFFSEDELIHVEYVDLYSDAEDPVLSGKIEPPTKASTPQYEYHFDDWNIPLINIQGITEVHAIYSEVVRKYTINFYNEDILESSVVLEYGSLPEFVGELEKPYVEYPEDYEHLGWIPEIAPVVCDQDYRAKYSESSHILDDWKTVAENVAKGTHKAQYYLGVLQRITLDYNNDLENIEVELVGYDHDITSDGKNKAGLTFICRGILKDTHIMNNSQDLNRDGWINSDMRNYLMDTIYPALPEDLREVIVPVIKRTSAGSASANVDEVVETVDSIWLPSLVELVDTYSNTEIYAAEGSTYEHMIGIDEEDSRARRIKKDHTGYARRYWTRSPVPYSSNEYWMISTLGGGISTYASYASHGVVFGFCVGIVES